VAIVASYEWAPAPPVDTTIVAAAEEQLAGIPTTAIPERAVLPPGSRMLLSPNLLFVGRQDNLRALATALKVGGTAAVTGLGGVGKTQLASEFAHRYGQYFAGGVYWLSFAIADAVLTEVISCGGPGGLDLRPDYRTLLPEDQARLVLSAWQSAVPRLLIFDNCEDEELLVRWRPPTGGARVLVTSRRKGWDPALGVSAFAVDVLGRPESVELLRRYQPGLRAGEAELEAIAAELGNLPLALHLAGSFLAKYRAVVGLQDYLSQLRRPELLEHRSLQGGGISPTKHVQNVARTFALSFDRLNLANPVDALAAGLLARAACFAAAEPIPRELLLDTLEQQEQGLEAALQAEDALARLVELGLLETQADEALRLHRLVRAFARNAAEDPEAQASVERTLIPRVREIAWSGNLIVGETVGPHLRSVTDLALEDGSERASELCNLLGNYLVSRGDYPAARFYLERALALQEALLSENHPDTALDLNDLGHAFLAEGDYAAARSFFERALPLWKLRGDEANAAATLDNLGQAALSSDPLAAERYFKEALTIRERVLGPASPQTATTLHNLGRVRSLQNDFHRAAQYYERSLAVREQSLGPDHPHTARSLVPIADLRLMSGDLVGARDCYRRVVAIYERTLGPDHRGTIAVRTALNRLPEALNGAGGRPPAQPKQGSAHEEVLRDATLAVSLNNIGYALWVAGDDDGARRNYQDALAIDEQTLGKTHPKLATTLNNLGKVLERQADYPGAWAFYERALANQQHAGQDDSLLTARILNNSGVLCRLRGDLQEARSRLERALSLRREALGEAHPDTATTLDNLGLLCQAEGDRRSARRLIERALLISRRALGDEHPDVARSLHDLGMVLHEQGALDEARERLEAALVIRERVLAPQHPDTAMTLIALGALARDQGDPEAERSYLEQALEICDRRLRPNHPVTRAARDRVAG
jgi:tetratricopeptide (TPR) repeat protein